MPENSRMSENGDTSEHGQQHGDANGGLSGELLSGGAGSGGWGSSDATSGSGNSGGDMLSSGSIERPPRRNLAAIVVSLVAVLAVIGGGVAYVGYHKLASSGAQPDEWAPSSSVAYIKIDLDPAASEKIAALRFEQKFPDAPHVTSADQLKDTLLSEAFDQPSSNIDYATDIKPWLGDRVALAAYPDASGKIQPVGILQVKDATQAQAGLTKLIHTGDGGMSAAGFAIENDYAIVGPSQAAVDAAVAAARTSSITASNQYAADVATLGGDRIGAERANGWRDVLPAQAAIDGPHDERLVGDVPHDTCPPRCCRRLGELRQEADVRRRRPDRFRGLDREHRPHWARRDWARQWRAGRRLAIDR